jgi:hypothetical protein
VSARRFLLAAGLALGVLATQRAGIAAPASADIIQGSRLAPLIVGTGKSDSPLLAQRSIVREWGESEDSTYKEVEVPGYKSEGWAMVASAAVPGTGQLYVGENSGFIYLLVEAAGWASMLFLRDRADQQKVDSQTYAGSPYDSTSAWNFSRYSRATGGDTLGLQQLYAGDPDAFYHQIGYNDLYADGWSNTADGNRNEYQSLESDYQSSVRKSRYAAGALILNHVVSALDALHAAREHNLPLKQNLQLKVGGNLSPRGPNVNLSLEARF